MLAHVDVARSVHNNAPGHTGPDERKYCLLAGPGRQLENSVVVRISDIHAAGTIDRYAVRVIEAGKWQYHRSIGSNRQFYHPVVTAIGNIDTAGLIDRYAFRKTQARERKFCLVTRSGRQHDDPMVEVGDVHRPG